MVVSCSSVAVPWPASLSTARLVLRPVDAADVPAVSRLWTDPEVRQYLGGPVAAAEVAPHARLRACLREISPPPSTVVAVTQEASDRSRHLLESIGMTLIDSFVEFDAAQVVFSVDRAALRA
jgi:RimJ/RimL family protein N-acetyltransferase